MDKLKIINRALSATGNGQLLVLDDGSPEWIAANNAFDRAIEYLASQNLQAFANKTFDLQRAGDAKRPPWKHAMQMPPDCWHLRTVIETEHGCDVSYTLLNNQILTMTDIDLRAIYTAQPEITMNFHGACVEYITMSVEAELWRGLNDDAETGIAMMREAERKLHSALGKVDQQLGPRPAKKSRIAIARRVRKIW